MEQIIKYPRTRHLQGSNLQPGDEDLSQVKYSELAGKYIVVEEKIDGGNSGISFSDDLEIQTQSRGHFLLGGPRERHFSLLKTWTVFHEERFFNLLGQRYLMYGEWMYAKHTVFYDFLPHYFLEFDIFDREREIFLSTAAREELIADAPVVSVPILYRGVAPKHLKDLTEMIKMSVYKTPEWKEKLIVLAQSRNLDVDRVLRETELSDLSEGLYIKVEDGEETVDRLKWVRGGFLQQILSNDSHWHTRPIIPNQLRPGVDIFSPTINHESR